MIAFAWFMLCIWPVVGIVLFRKLDLPLALCVNFFASYLILPSALSIDLPVLPEFNKYTIPTLVALVMTTVVLANPQQNPRVLPGWLPREPVTLILLGLLMLGNFGTVLSNQDPLFYGPRVLPGTRLYDAFAMLLNMLMMVLPYLLARRVLATAEAQRTLLVVLVVSILIYTVPALWEVRMSPQLHRQIYGFFPHSFAQQIRAGGFRPHVFLNHGLALATMLALAILAAAGLYRAGLAKTRAKWALAAGWLFVVLILAKSLGALMITVLILPLVLLLTTRIQLMVAAGIAATVLIFPILRSIDVVPVDYVVSVAEGIDPARAESLEFRLRNEDILLEKARERPLFGWGGWNRNRVFDDKGQDVSVTDGAWVTEMGVGGWTRYIAVFGLLCWPIVGLFFAKRHRIDAICAILALIMAGKLIDLIPNAGMVPVIWLIAGSLLGRLEIRLTDLQQDGQPDQAATDPAPPRYARDFGGPPPERDPGPSARPRNGLGYARPASGMRVRKQ